MLNLIIGGAGSGKSAFAERLVCRLPGKRVYLATMTAGDAESRSRIARHRAQRAALEFETLECGTDLAGSMRDGAAIPDRANVLLEDLSNLLATEMFGPHGGGIGAVRAGVQALRRSCGHLTVVTNDVFADGNRYEGEMLAYLENLAALNRELALAADLAVEVVCGVPNVLKGSLP